MSSVFLKHVSCCRCCVLCVICFYKFENYNFEMRTRAHVGAWMLKGIKIRNWSLIQAVCKSKKRGPCKMRQCQPRTTSHNVFVDAGWHMSLPILYPFMCMRSTWNSCCATWTLNPRQGMLQQLWIRSFVPIRKCSHISVTMSKISGLSQMDPGHLASVWLRRSRTTTRPFTCFHCPKVPVKLQHRPRSVILQMLQVQEIGTGIMEIPPTKGKVKAKESLKASAQLHVVWWDVLEEMGKTEQYASITVWVPAPKLHLEGHALKDDMCASRLVVSRLMRMWQCTRTIKTTLSDYPWRMDMQVIQRREARHRHCQHRLNHWPHLQQTKLWCSSCFVALQGFHPHSNEEKFLR